MQLHSRHPQHHPPARYVVHCAGRRTVPAAPRSCHRTTAVQSCDPAAGMHFVRAGFHRETPHRTVPASPGNPAGPSSTAPHGDWRTSPATHRAGPRGTHASPALATNSPASSHRVAMALDGMVRNPASSECGRRDSDARTSPMVDREGVLRNAAEHEFLYRARRIVRVVGIEVLFGQDRDAAGLPACTHAMATSGAIRYGLRAAWRSSIRRMQARGNQ